MKHSGRNSTQELLGIRSFTRYGLQAKDAELLFFSVTPTNISVLSPANVEIKINSLALLLTTLPDLGILSADSYECFDDNKAYLQSRLENEPREEVRTLLQKDVDYLDRAQAEMSTARQFAFVVRLRDLKPDQVFETANTISRAIANQGFETHRMTTQEIKRSLAIFFDAGMNGDRLPDFDGTGDDDLEAYTPYPRAGRGYPHQGFL